MFIYDDGRIFRYIPGDLSGPPFIYETTKSSHVNVIPVSHGILYNAEKGFHGYLYICLVDTCLLRNFRNYLCFCHNL